MKPSPLYLIITFVIFTFTIQAQSESNSLSATITVSSELKNKFKTQGRLLLFICDNVKVEPRHMVWPSPTVKTYIFAKNLSLIHI